MIPAWNLVDLCNLTCRKRCDVDTSWKMPPNAIFRRGYLVPVLYRGILHEIETVSDKEMKLFVFDTFRARRRNDLTAVRGALCACRLFWKSERPEFRRRPVVIESIVIQASWDAVWKGAHADCDHEGSSNGGKNFGSDRPRINMENTTSNITARRPIFAQNHRNAKMEIAQKLGVAVKPSFQEIFFRI